MGLVKNIEMEVNILEKNCEETLSFNISICLCLFGVVNGILKCSKHLIVSEDYVKGFVSHLLI